MLRAKQNFMLREVKASLLFSLALGASAKALAVGGLQRDLCEERLDTVGYSWLQQSPAAKMAVPLW